MSTQTQPPESEAQSDETERVEKEVVVTAYAEPDRFSTKRAFAAMLDPDDETDYRAREVTETEHRSVSFGENFESSGIWKYDFQDLVSELIEAGADIPTDENGAIEPFEQEFDLFSFIGDEPAVLDVPVTLSYSIEDSEEYVVSSPGRKAMGHILHHLVEEVFQSPLTGGLVKRDHVDRWCDPDDEDADDLVSIRKGRMEPQKLLTHHSKRTPDNRFEDPTERLAIQYTVSMGPAPQDRIGAWSEEVVGEMSTYLGRHDAIDKVRISSCRVTKEGDCYGV